MLGWILGILVLLMVCGGMFLGGYWIRTQHEFGYQFILYEYLMMRCTTKEASEYYRLRAEKIYPDTSIHLLQFEDLIDGKNHGRDISEAVRGFLKLEVPLEGFADYSKALIQVLRNEEDIESLFGFARNW